MSETVYLLTWHYILEERSHQSNYCKNINTDMFSLITVCWRPMVKQMSQKMSRFVSICWLVRD